MPLPLTETPLTPDNFIDCVVESMVDKDYRDAFFAEPQKVFKDLCPMQISHIRGMGEMSGALMLMYNFVKDRDSTTLKQIAYTICWASQTIRWGKAGAHWPDPTVTTWDKPV